MIWKRVNISVCNWSIDSCVYRSYHIERNSDEWSFFLVYFPLPHFGRIDDQTKKIEKKIHQNNCIEIKLNEILAKFSALLLLLLAIVQWMIDFHHFRIFFCCCLPSYILCGHISSMDTQWYCLYGHLYHHYFYWIKKRV